MSLVSRNRIKEICTENGIDNTATDFPQKLDQKVTQLIKEACERAKQNNRRTVMGKDA